LGVCNDAATFIHKIQGIGAVSPKVVENLVVEGVVTGVFQDDGLLGGFFIEEEDAHAGDNASTSEGLFIYNTTNAVSMKDLVRISGKVDEFKGLTQLKN
jgi:predicted extracellular nuclease